MLSHHVFVVLPLRFYEATLLFLHQSLLFQQSLALWITLEQLRVYMQGSFLFSLCSLLFLILEELWVIKVL